MQREFSEIRAGTTLRWRSMGSVYTILRPDPRINSKLAKLPDCWFARCVDNPNDETDSDGIVVPVGEERSIWLGNHEEGDPVDINHWIERWEVIEDDFDYWVGWVRDEHASNRRAAGE